MDNISNIITNSTNSTQSSNINEQIIKIVTPIIFSLVIVIGLVGNILVIGVVMFNVQMRNTTNVLIVNLAVSDLLFLMFCVPFTVYNYVSKIWIFADWWCGVLNYLQHISAYLSVWTLVFMAIDRYLAVVFPIQSMTWRTVRNAGIAIGTLWCLVCLACIPVLTEYGVASYTYRDKNCTACVQVKFFFSTQTRQNVLLFYISFNVFAYLIPLTVTCLCYIVLLRKLWTTSRPGMGLRAKANEEANRAKRKVTLMVTSVTVVFAVCWLPQNVAFFYQALIYPRKDGSDEFVFVFVTSQVLAYTNSCLNPILYVFLSETYRKAFKNIFWTMCSCCCNNQQQRGGYMLGVEVTTNPAQKTNVNRDAGNGQKNNSNMLLPIAKSDNKDFISNTAITEVTKITPTAATETCVIHSCNGIKNELEGVQVSHVTTV